MAQCNFVIYDSQTGLYLINGYNSDLSRCYWGGLNNNPTCFGTQAQADAAITGWGQTPGARYVGQVPPPPK